MIIFSELYDAHINDVLDVEALWRRPRAIRLAIFGRENLEDAAYRTALSPGPSDKGFFALRKLLNPFKWLELSGAYLLFGISVVGGLTLALAIGISKLAVACLPKWWVFDFLESMIVGALSIAYGLFSMAQSVIGDLISSVTSPINSIISAWAEDIKLHPKKAAMKLLLCVTMASLLVTAVAFSGGAAAIPAAVLFLKPLVAFISPAITFVGKGIGVLAAKTLIGAAAVWTSLTITQKMGGWLKKFLVSTWHMMKKLNSDDFENYGSDDLSVRQKTIVEMLQDRSPSIVGSASREREERGGYSYSDILFGMRLIGGSTPTAPDHDGPDDSRRPLVGDSTARPVVSGARPSGSDHTLRYRGRR